MSIVKQKQKFLSIFNKTLKECQEHDDKNAKNKHKRNKIQSLNSNNEKLKSNDLLFAFNQDNKYRAAKKIKPYTDFKRIPSGNL